MLILLIVAIYFGIKLGFEYGFDFWGLLVGLFSGLIAGFLLSIFVGAFFPTTPRLYETTQLIALKDNSGIQGSFWLFGGHVESKPVYYYMYEKDGGAVLDSVLAEQSVVYENGQEKPRVEKYIYVFESSVMNFVAIPIRDPLYKIYIPEKSVTREYKIDLQ